MSTPDVQESTEDIESNDALKWRRARYEELGFTESEALSLAKSIQIEYTGSGKDKDPRKEWRQPLSWQKVKKALDSGCSKEMALQLFLS